MDSVAIVDACRTPIGKFGGALSSSTAVELGAFCTRQLLERVIRRIPDNALLPAQKALFKKHYFHANNLTADRLSTLEGKPPVGPAILIEESFIGNVLSAGLGQNPARQIALHAGIAREIPATTISQVCGSGMKAVILASQLIGAGIHCTMLAGGTESMSQAPFLLDRLRWGHKFGNTELIDSVVRDGLSDAFHKYPMGTTAETIAQQWNISRGEQDEFAYHSQKKAGNAEAMGLFSDERVSYVITKRKKQERMDRDEFIRADTSLEALAALPPVFSHEGTVTAGNASGINDGAAMLYLMNQTLADTLGIQTLARIVATSNTGLSEEIMGYGPYSVVKDLLTQTGLSLDDISFIELNEAFASQSLAVIQDLGLTINEAHYIDEQHLARINPLGGAIALGHPIGCSGARILVTLAHQLHRTAHAQNFSKRIYGIAALCVGGGQGCGVLLEC